MRRLTPSQRDEQGAIVVFVALFSTVLLAVAALVIDVGSLLHERRQLQNGADAGALGIAQTCVDTPASCTAALTKPLAQQMANGNSVDDASNVTDPIINMANKTVTVTTSTKSGGNNILPYWFAQSFTGEQGKTVHASATATWGGLATAPVIPLTISICEFNTATNTNTAFDKPVVIYFHGKASPCKLSPSGADIPGGYGWLRDNNDSDANDCNITPSVGNIINADTGLPGTPHSCDLTSLVGKDVLVPVYESLTGSGVNGLYRIYGFGQFHLTGFFFSNSDKGTIGSNPYPCKKPDTCIGGSFVRFVPSGPAGGPNLGNPVFLVS